MSSGVLSDGKSHAFCQCDILNATIYCDAIFYTFLHISFKTFAQL